MKKSFSFRFLSNRIRFISDQTIDIYDGFNSEDGTLILRDYPWEIKQGETFILEDEEDQEESEAQPKDHSLINIWISPLSDPINIKAPRMFVNVPIDSFIFIEHYFPENDKTDMKILE